MRLSAVFGLAILLTGCSTDFTVIPIPPTTLTANAGGPYTGTAGAGVTFSGSHSTAPQGETISYTWTFGDNATATGIAPTHIYLTAGLYTVSLTVTDSGNQTSTATSTATIAALPPPLPPVANAAGPYTGTLGTAVFFDGSGSYDPQNETLTYAWDFGDGSTGAGIKPGHVYWATGTYAISLTVTNTSNLSDGATATATITVAPPLPPPAGASTLYQVATTSVSVGGVSEHFFAVFAYTATGSGTVSPILTLTAPDSGELYQSLATGLKGNLYIADSSEQVNGIPSIQFLAPPTANGTVTPLRTITGPDTQLITADAITVDNYGNMYIVSLAPSTGTVPFANILEFAAGATGDALPIRTITLPVGQETIGEMHIAVDATGNLIVTNYGDGTDAIQVFTPIQSGNATPVRTVSDPIVSYLLGVGLDPSGNIYVLTNALTVEEFPGGATGTGATPLQTIALTAPGEAGAISAANGLALDTAGNIYVGVHVAPNFSNDTILVYPAGATASTSPTIEIVSPGGDSLTVH